MSNCSQKLLDQLECCRAVFQTFAWFVRPLFDTILCVWVIWSGSNNRVYMYHAFHWLAQKNKKTNPTTHQFSSWPMTRNRTLFGGFKPFSHTQKTPTDSLRRILRVWIVYLIIPRVTAFTSFHTTRSKKPTFYEITHIIIGGHALSDMFIKNCHTQICADKKNVVNVKTNHNSNSVKELCVLISTLLIMKTWVKTYEHGWDTCRAIVKDRCCAHWHVRYHFGRPCIVQRMQSIAHAVNRTYDASSRMRSTTALTQDVSQTTMDRFTRGVHEFPCEKFPGIRFCCRSGPTTKFLNVCENFILTARNVWHVKHYCPFTRSSFCNISQTLRIFCK